MQTREEKLAQKREYARHRREWLKAHDLCTVCGQERPVKGRHACADCLAMDSERHIALFAEKTAAEKQVIKEKITLQDRERRARRKENRECVKCGKKLPEGHLFFSCDECRARARRVTREWKERKIWAEV